MERIVVTGTAEGGQPTKHRQRAILSGDGEVEVPAS